MNGTGKFAAKPWSVICGLSTLWVAHTNKFGHSKNAVQTVLYFTTLLSNACVVFTVRPYAKRGMFVP